MPSSNVEVMLGFLIELTRHTSSTLYQLKLKETPISLEPITGKLIILASTVLVL